jgi:hypothetical protein
MAGFSLGYVVVISTRPHEIGREQFCARFHRYLHSLNFISPTFATSGLDMQLSV